MVRARFVTEMDKSPFDRTFKDTCRLTEMLPTIHTYLIRSHATQPIQANPLSLTIGKVYRLLFFSWCFLFLHVFFHAGADLANIDDDTVLENPPNNPKEPAGGVINISKGSYKAHELVNTLNLGLTSCHLVTKAKINDYQLKYTVEVTDPSVVKPVLHLTPQLAFKLGLVPFHSAFLTYSRTNENKEQISVALDVDQVYYLDIISHLTTLSVESSGHTFTQHKIARVNLAPEILQGLLERSRTFATFDLNMNWTAVVVKKQDLDNYAINLHDMLNCKVNLGYIELVVDFRKIRIQF